MLRRSNLSVLVVLVTFNLVLSQAQVALATTPVTSQGAASAQEGADVKERPDAVSTMVAAVSEEHRVEDTSQRTPTTATYANPNGTWTTEAYAGAVRDKVDDDKWVPVDPSLEDAGNDYVPAAAPVDAKYSDGGDKTVATAILPNDGSVQVGWDSSFPAPSVSGDELTYGNAAGDADLVVNSNPDGFDYSMVLDHAPDDGVSPIEYRVPISAEDASLVGADDGSIIFKRGKKVLASMSAPVMWDSSTGDGASVHRPVAATLEGTGDTRVLLLKPDMSFLRDPATVYPVTVDPVFSIGAAGDTWVASSGQTASQSSSPELDVGSINLGLTKARSYLSFDLSGMQAQGMTGTPYSATLSLDNFKTGACTPGSNVTVRRVTTALSITAVTWSTQPTTTDTNDAEIVGSFGGGTGCPENTASVSVANMVGDAMAAGSTLNMQIKADNESSTAGYRKYRSNENGTPSAAPLLSVTYDRGPDTPSNTTVSPGNPGYVTSLTPTINTVVTDPDGGPIRGYFEVRSGTSPTGTLVWSGRSSTGSSFAASGDTVSATVSAGALSDGSQYTVYAYGEDDSTVRSAASQSSTFTVDVTAPTASITATNYTNNSWSDPAPSTNTFTYVGTPDTVSFETITDGIPKTVAPNETIGTNKAFYFGLVMPAGWNVFQATAVDKAGNRSGTQTFSFGSGVPGFAQPYPNEEATSSVPVNASGPAGTGVTATLYWKFKSGGPWNLASHVLQSGSPWTGALASASGHLTTGDLVWDATSETYGASSTLSAPAVVTLQAVFHYPTGDKYATPVTVQLVPSAFGGSFPTTSVGPASIALFTGEASIGVTDAADAASGLSRSFSSLDRATLVGSPPGLFGPGWSDPLPLEGSSQDSQDDVIDNRALDGTIVIVDPHGGSQVFSPVSTVGTTTTFAPLAATGDTTALILTSTVSGTPVALELDRPLGTSLLKTKWTYQVSDNAEPAGWTFQSIDAPGTSSDLSVDLDHQRPIFMPESAPGVASTCNATGQTAGCRGLRISYTGTGSDMRVASVSLVVGADLPASPAVKVLAAYSYTPDAAKMLSSACSPSPGGVRPPLCTSYTYATIAGRNLVASETPPGLTPWRFNYDTTGRLISVKRTKPTGGDAVWSIDYSLSAPTAGPTMTASAVAQWGQLVAPTKVVAVYAPTAGTPDVTNADLYYTSDSGTETNTSSYGPSGWAVDTTWYDGSGNVVQHLAPDGWMRAHLAPSASQLRIAAEASSYTVYNDDWSDPTVDGTRVVDVYGPASTSSLEDGTSGLYRSHTHTMYADDPNVDPALVSNMPPGTTDLGLVVETTQSVSNVARTTDYPTDTVVTKYGYDPVVSGDENGWTSGSPTKVVADANGTSPATTVTRYDASGNLLESRAPGGSTDSTGAGNDAHATITTYYSAAGTGDCSGKPAWVGLVCKTYPAGQPAGAKIPTTFFTNYDDDFNPTVVEEVIPGDSSATRTTYLTYDALDRVTEIRKTTSGSSVTNETIDTGYGFNDATGLPVSTTDLVGGNVETTGYDSWGRPLTYQDATGTSSTSTYNAAGNLATRTTSSSTYTYAYDSHQNLTSVDAGGGVGSFTYAYLPDGQIDSVSYPNGVVAKRNYDATGNQTGLEYKQGSTTLLGFASAQGALGQTVSQSSPQSSQQFTYDGLGRLTKAQDTRQAACVTRTYGFDAASDRTTFRTFSPASSGACQQSGSPAVDKANTFDSAGRITNSGYSYDTLGRTLTQPQGDGGPNAAGALTATYHADDHVSSLEESVLFGVTAHTVKMTYALDPSERINTTTTKVDGAEIGRQRNRYASPSDVPDCIDSSADGGTTWTTTRYVQIPALGAVASTTGGTTTIQIADQRGDIVGNMPDIAGTLTLGAYSETDEFGNRSASSPDLGRYAYHGADQRSTDTPGRGLMLMGSRLYNPSTGAFLSTDSVPGGNVTAYTYPENPTDTADLSGNMVPPPDPPSCKSHPVPSMMAPGHTGFVAIPGEYCYNKAWGGDSHDYCSHYADGYGRASWRGPCAYHDLCLSNGWGLHRSDCDHMLDSYAHRNCNAVYSSGWFTRAKCNRRVGVMYAGVTAWSHSWFPDYHYHRWPCAIVYAKGNPGDGIDCVDPRYM